MEARVYNSITEADNDLALEMGDLAEDPLEFVRFSYPWNRGDLRGFTGPDTWQIGYLNEWGQEIRLRKFDGITPVLPIRMTTTSGHGVGKSALTAWVADFIMSTRPHSKGIVSANSIPQLETKTWAEIAKWTKICITGRWFRVTSGRGSLKMVHRQHPETWRLDGMAWSKDRPAAFAGLHAATSTPFYIFDEASEIARIILETAMGGLTDGEPMFFMFSNPTASSGFFFDSHHDMRHRFKVHRIDSRQAKMTNKALINEWIEDWGINSDFVKVRVLGEFPLQGNRQFISSAAVSDAMDAARSPVYVATDPVILGVDVARYGMNESAIYVRRGRDGRTIAPKIFRGLDTVQLAHEVRKINEELYADAINVDGGYGHGVIDVLRNWGVPNVNEIHNGSPSPDPEYDNMATYMMGEARTWLKQDHVTLPIDPVLKRQLSSREYKMVEGKRGTAIRIEPKEEMEKDDSKESPDRADGFCLTFAVPVPRRDLQRTMALLSGLAPSGVVGVEYDRFGDGSTGGRDHGDYDREKY